MLFTGAPVAPGQVVTATATSVVDGTSELSACVVVDAYVAPPPPEECPQCPAPADQDKDAVTDAADGCAGTPSSSAVDAAGCSLTQFCASVDASSRQGAAACKRADWKNDEPLMERKDADCTMDKGGKGKPDDRCVAR